MSDKTIEFINKAKEVHGDKYDYSYVEYIKAINKIIIICKKHGNFIQTPNSHLRGSGCVKCFREKSSIAKKSNTDEFIEKSIKVHDNKYDYSSVVYISASDKIVIKCKKHGIFEQTPNSHLCGRGCDKCKNEDISDRFKSNKQEFENKAINIHGNKYDYSKVEYVNSQTKVIITCKIHGDFEQIPNSHLQGNGCNKCAGNLITTQDEFINFANQIHQNAYNYSNVKYINSKTNVLITCKIHGDFEQTPSIHIHKKAGCYKCAGKLSTNQNEFITIANKIHKNTYDYSKVEYVNSQTKVIITCKIHGDFEQIPNSHLQGNGCNECGKNRSKVKRTSTFDEFISKANEIHKNAYDYSNVTYINSQSKVLITCKIHGDFEQKPSSHLQGSGCNKCGKNRSKDKQLFTLDDFISNANKIHNNIYDYSKVNYTGANNDVIIICKKHDEFKQKPSKHINAQQGCPKCAFTNYSKQQIHWLDFISKLLNINIQHAENDGEYIFDNLKADGYCKETNTIYEFHGDFWHGNPKIYNSTDVNKKNSKTFGELYQNTLKKEQLIKDLGYNLVVMWESDWIKLNRSIKILQIKFRNSKFH